MSQSSANEFLDRTETDASLGKRLANLGAEADLGDLQRVASEAGFQFTGEELVAASKAREASLEGELSDAELSQVAGGTTGIIIKISVPKIGTVKITIKVK